MASGTDDRIDTARALRDLTHAFVTHDRDSAGLRELRAVADEQVDAMNQGGLRDRLALMQAARAANPGGSFGGTAGGSGSGFEDRAVGGRANPTGVEFEARFEGDEVIADVLLRRGFEGPPGRAHGGIVAAVFDDITGFVIGQLG